MLVTHVCGPEGFFIGPEDAPSSKNTSPWHLPGSVCLPTHHVTKHLQNCDVNVI